MKRELKRHIKEDELVTGLARAVAWARLHVNELKVTAAIVTVVGVGALALNYFQGNRNREAEKAFAEALETFQAPVGPAAAVEGTPPGPRFATAPEKFQKAVAAFDALSTQYPSLPAGKRARYYAALSRVELGDLDAAEKALTEIASYRDADSLEPALARLAVADLSCRRGQPERAVDTYRKLLDEESPGLPKDHLLMRLASALEEAKRAPEAGASYKRLVDEFPQSVYAGEARRRADFLTGSGSQG